MQKSTILWDWSEDGKKWTLCSADVRTRLEKLWSTASTGGASSFELKLKGETHKYDVKTMIQTNLTNQRQMGLRRRFVPCCTSKHELVYNPGTTGQSKVCYDCNKNVKESFRCPEACCGVFVRCLACQGPEFAEARQVSSEAHACMPWWNLPGGVVFCPHCGIAQTGGTNCTKCGIFLPMAVEAAAPPTYATVPPPVEHKITQADKDRIALDAYVESLKQSFTPVFANQQQQQQQRGLYSSSSPSSIYQDHQRLNDRLAALRLGVQQVPVPVDSLDNSAPPPYAANAATNALPPPSFGSPSGGGLSQHDIDRMTLEQRVDVLKQSFSDISVTSSAAQAALLLQDSQRLDNQVTALREGLLAAPDAYQNLSMDQWVAVQSQRAVDSMFDFLTQHVGLSIDESLAVCRLLRDRGVDWARFQTMNHANFTAVGLAQPIALRLDAALASARAA